MKAKHLKLLNQYANNHSLAKGGGIKVTITEHSTRLEPVENSGMKYEDCNLLHDLIRGADHFICHLEREGYQISRRKK